MERGLQIQSLGIGTDGFPDLGDVGEIDERGLDAQAAEELRQHSISAAVDILARHKVVAGRKEEKDAGDGGHSGGKGKALHPAFEAGDDRPQVVPRRVSGAGVIVGAECIDARLLERRGVVYGNADRSGRRVDLVSRMQYFCAYLHTLSSL